MTLVPAMTPPVDWNAALVEHDRWLRTVVYARVGEPAAVDDVMQEVALAAVRQRAPLLDPAKLAPWLYRLAIVQSLLYRRKQGRWRKLTIRVAEKLQPVEEDGGLLDPLQRLMAAERRELVRKAVDRLPRRDVEILLLKYTEVWSYAQLADHLGISTSAVEARLHRARGRLRRELTLLGAIEVES